MGEPGRSWTDPLTNVTAFAGLRLEEHLPRLLEVGAAPPELAPSFMHEATHHWCFDSLVGSALALLHMRSRRTALRYADTPDDTNLSHALAEDLNRYETATAFLRPLAEGMALFAEFDANTRQGSRILSTPLDQAAWFFVGPAIDPGSVSPDELVAVLTAKVLQPMRLGSQLLARKVSLLGQPLACDGDAYLPGYLLVRALWRSAACQVDKLLNETDLFLAYLRSYLYDDCGLVSELLDTSNDEIRSAEAVANRINARLRRFTEIRPEDIEAFQDAVLAGSQEGRSASIHLEPGEIQLSVRRLEQALGAHQEPSSARDALIAHRYERLLARRGLLYLGSWPAKVEVVNSRFRVIGDGRVVREGRAIEGAPDGRGQGTVDVVYWHARRTSACIVLRGGTLVATQSFAPLQRDNDPAVVEIASERDENRKLIGGLDKFVELVIAKEQWIGVARQHARNQVAAILDNAYLPPALPRVPKTQLRATIDALRERGFYPLLDRDRQLIEGFAQMGLLCSVLLPREQLLRPLFASRGLDFDGTLDAGNAMERSFGIGRIRLLDGCVLPDV